MSRFGSQRAVADFWATWGEPRGLLAPRLEGGSFPVVLFDDRGLRLRRPEAAPDEARKWLRLDYEDLRAGSGALAMVGPESAYGLLAVLDPRLLVDLAGGPLAGSIELEGQERIGDELTTRFSANFDVPKALDDTRAAAYDEERREHVSRLLELMKVSGDVHPGEVWIGADGNLRRFELALRIEVDRDERYLLTVVVDIGRTVVPRPSVATPSADSIVRVDKLVPLWRSAANAASAGGAQLDG